MALVVVAINAGHRSELWLKKAMINSQEKYIWTVLYAEKVIFVDKAYKVLFLYNQFGLYLCLGEGQLCTLKVLYIHSS